MTWRVQLSKKARRQLDRVPEPDVSRILARLEALKAEPRPPGVLQLEPGVYRLRCGDWRVLYDVEDRAALVIIQQVLRRNERTYRRA